MVSFLDLHTHTNYSSHHAISIQSLSLTEAVTQFNGDDLVSIGIHPWYGKLENLDEQIEQLRVFAEQPNVKLIGECGLDKLRGEDISQQITILAAQLKLAEELQKPVILHCVKAFDELIALKNLLKPTVSLIIHGFSKKHEMAKQLVQHGFYFSFGAAVLNSTTVALAVEQTTKPFFLETDDSSISIEEVYQKVAQIKKISLDELKDVIFANWKNFNII